MLPKNSTRGAAQGSSKIWTDQTCEPAPAAGRREPRRGSVNSSTMQILKCPHCGAPPPAPIEAVGQFTYHCAYCKQQSILGAPAAPPVQQGPTFVVIQAPSDHDDDDDDDHHPQEHRTALRVAAAHNFSWLIWMGVVLVLSLGGGAAGFSRCTKRNALLSSLVWDGSEPLHCSGNENIAVSGVEATFTSGAAIVAGGNCHVRCTDCKLSAPTAIEATGNAQVAIVNGTVKGTTTLAEASANARIDISGNVVASGKVTQTGNGRVVAPPSASTAAPATSTTAPATSATPAGKATASAAGKPVAAVPGQPKPAKPVVKGKPGK